MVKPSFSAGLWVFAQSEEKFGGYNRALSAREQIAADASFPGLKGLDLISPLHVSLENAVEVKGWLEDAGLKASAQSIRTLNNLLSLLDRLDRAALRTAQAEMDAVATQRLVQELSVA